MKSRATVGAETTVIVEAERVLARGKDEDSVGTPCMNNEKVLLVHGTLNWAYNIIIQTEGGVLIVQSSPESTIPCMYVVQVHTTITQLPHLSLLIFLARCIVHKPNLMGTYCRCG